MAMKLGDRLREVRHSRNRTLLQVAGATQLSVSYLSDLERGRTKPSMATLERLAGYYEVPMADLLSNVDGSGPSSLDGLAPGLLELVRSKRIDEADARDLNRVELRGKRPQTEEEWYQLYLYLRSLMRQHLE